MLEQINNKKPTPKKIYENETQKLLKKTAASNLIPQNWSHFMIPVKF